MGRIKIIRTEKEEEQLKIKRKEYFRNRYLNNQLLKSQLSTHQMPTKFQHHEIREIDFDSTEALNGELSYKNNSSIHSNLISRGVNEKRLQRKGPSEDCDVEIPQKFHKWSRLHRILHVIRIIHLSSH